jgi:hypothetical protein
LLDELILGLETETRNAETVYRAAEILKAVDKVATQRQQVTVSSDLAMVAPKSPRTRDHQHSPAHLLLLLLGAGRCEAAEGLTAALACATVRQAWEGTMHAAVRVAGVLQIAGSVLAYLVANSAIHQILGAISFGSGLTCKQFGEPAEPSTVDASQAHY